MTSLLKSLAINTSLARQDDQKELGRSSDGPPLRGPLTQPAPRPRHVYANADDVTGMQSETRSEPFEEIAGLLPRLAIGEASNLLAVVKPPFYQSFPEQVLRVRHLTTIQCPAYARIFHRLSVADKRGFAADWRWSRLGPPPLTADLSLATLVATRTESLSTEGLSLTADVGQLDHRSTTMLASLIRKAALANRTSYFYFWNGLGIFLDEGPYVYQGSATAVGHFFRPASTNPQTEAPWWVFQSPTLWWCEDAWFVATHPDAVSTYVGGPESLIAEIIKSRFLEAVSTDENTPVDDSHMRPGFVWPGQTPQTGS
jgi:hypothetical protein